jgi:hypothetical protein
MSKDMPCTELNKSGNLEFRTEGVAAGFQRKNGPLILTRFQWESIERLRRPRFDLIQIIADFVPRTFQLVAVLKVHPELGRCTKILR